MQIKNTRYSLSSVDALKFAYESSNSTKIHVVTFENIGIEYEVSFAAITANFVESVVNSVGFTTVEDANEFILKNNLNNCLILGPMGISIPKTRINYNV